MHTLIHTHTHTDNTHKIIVVCYFFNAALARNPEEPYDVQNMSHLPYEIILGKNNVHVIKIHLLLGFRKQQHHDQFASQLTDTRTETQRFRASADERITANGALNPSFLERRDVDTRVNLIKLKECCLIFIHLETCRIEKETRGISMNFAGEVVYGI